MAIIWDHPSKSSNLTPEGKALVCDMIAKGETQRDDDGVRWMIGAVDAAGWRMVAVADLSDADIWKPGVDIPADS